MDTLLFKNMLTNFLVLLKFFILGLTGTYANFMDHSVQYFGPQVVDEGRSFTLSCILNVNDLPQWTINGEQITKYNDKGYIMTQRIIGTFKREMTLRVEGAQLLHEGEYRCDGYSREFHWLEIIEADDVGDSDDDDDEEDDDDKDEESDTDITDLIQSIGDQILEVNKTINLHCTSAETDDTPVYWYKNYRQIVPSKGSRTKINRTHLIIENAQISDAAEYMCTVDFLINTGLKEIGRTFQIKSPVEIKDFPDSKLNVGIGKNFSLLCDVKGFPRPNITWYKDNVLLTSLMKEDPTRIWVYSTGGQLNARLTVRAVNIQDRGLYTCRAENSINIARKTSDEKSIFVEVWENLLVTNEDENGLKLLVIGQPLTLQCNTTECPQCGLVWYKDGKRLDEILDEEDDDDDRINIDDETNTITIQRATLNDSGIYMCAINKDQLDIVLNASIEVQSEIKIKHFESASDVVTQGQPLELYCIVTASPPPLIKWFRGDVEIDDSDERIKLLEHKGLKKAKLLIEEADFPDRSNYTCEAYNRVHSSRITIFIRVKDKLAALWPFLGICAEVVILCTIIFVYEKRKSNEERENENTFNAENRNIRDPSSSQTVRQRK